MDFILLNILSGVKVGVLVWSGIRHIMCLGYWDICLSFTQKAYSHNKDTRLTLYLIVVMIMIDIWR